jgi:5-methylcytosine-specific restriction endonuclease McrA
MPLTRKTPLTQRKPLYPKAAPFAKPTKKKTVSWYKKQCDILFSRLIRSIGYCERCGGVDNLQCSHVIPRTVLTLRCDPENAMSLCMTCHLYWWHKHPLEASEWFSTRYPGRYEKLREKERASLGQKVDWITLYEQLKK